MGQNGSRSELELKQSFPSSSTDRPDEWYKHGEDDNDGNEVQPYTVESDVVEEATSEEVR